MKQAITIPSVVPGRRVRWIVELSAEREELPLPISALAPAPQTPARIEAVPAAKPAASSPPSIEGVASPPIIMRRGTPAFRLLLTGVAAVGFVVAFAVGRRLAADEEYVVADAAFASQVAADRDPAVEPIAKPVATPAVPAPATPPVAAVEPPTARPIAATPVTTEAVSPPPRKVTKTVAVSPPAPAIVEKPVVDGHVAETPAPAATAAAASNVATSPSQVAPAATSAADEVTITGCLEMAKEDDRFRLSDTEGANAPQARSWRSGFFKKRSASVDLIGSAETLSLSRDVGRRVAATGVLSSRKLTVSSVRVVSPSCN